jgi:apolipoprotein N-acyltransferase
MDSTIIVKYAIIAGLAAISGFLLVGFFIYSTYAAILWLKEKKSKEKIWGGLIGVGLNGLIFALTFPRIYPIIIEAIDKIFRRFL